MNGIGSHEKPYRGSTDHWLTPKYILDALGPFDLDPCAAPPPRPYPTAIEMTSDHGLAIQWFRRVWLNPPYGPETGKWLKKLKEHGNGIALIFARTETKMFFSYIWDGADAVFFFRKRLAFNRPDGSRAHGAGGPSALIAYGASNANALWRSGLEGSLLTGWKVLPKLYKEG